MNKYQKILKEHHIIANELHNKITTSEDIELMIVWGKYCENMKQLVSYLPDNLNKKFNEN